MLMDMVRGGLHRVQCVRGHDLAVQVDLVKHHRGRRHLVRLLADLGLRRDHRGGGGRADQGCEQPDLVPVGVFRAPDRLAVQPQALSTLMSSHGRRWVENAPVMQQRGIALSEIELVTLDPLGELRPCLIFDG
jgi:hypothetical protein